MIKIFEFSDGGRAERFDTATGRVATWTREDLDYSILAFCKSHTKEEAQKIFYHCCKVTHPSQIPVYAYGTIIAMIAQIVTQRPDKGAHDERPVLRLPQRKDDA